MDTEVYQSNLKLLLDSHTTPQLIRLCHDLKLTATLTSKMRKKEIAKQILDAPEFKLKTLSEIEELNKELKEKKRKTAYLRVKQALEKNSTPKANPDHTKPCLIYTGHLNKNGYGTITVLGRNVQTHVVSYALSRGITIESISQYNEKKEKLQVCHGKGCPCSCIEPTHLTLDTARENNHSHKIRDGTLMTGEKNHRNTITEELAILIKHSKGDGNQKDRALRFGVAKSLVKHIDFGDGWAHIPDKNGNVVSTLERREKIRQHKIKHTESLVFTDEDWKQVAENIKTNTVERQLKEGMSACWIWKNKEDTDKYYIMSYRCIQCAAHIMSLEAHFMEKRSDLANQKVLHKCNIKACCNPSHLYYGCMRDSGIDAVKIGNKNIKVTESQVVEIRNAKGTHKSIAEKYGICGQTVRDIKNRKTWLWVKD